MQKDYGVKEAKIKDLNNTLEMTKQATSKCKEHIITHRANVVQARKDAIEVFSKTQRTNVDNAKDIRSAKDALQFERDEAERDYKDFKAQFVAIRDARIRENELNDEIMHQLAQRLMRECGNTT